MRSASMPSVSLSLISITTAVQLISSVLHLRRNLEIRSITVA